MTTTQKAVIAVLLAGAVVAVSVYQARQSANLRRQVLALEQQQEQVDDMKRQRDHATVELARIAAENEALKKRPSDVLKLRGEVGQLRQKNEELGSKSALSKLTASPEARKLLRDQQKVGMTAIYKGFFDQAKLTPEQTGKLSDLLADHVMENVDQITAMLHDKTGRDQIDQAFAAREGELRTQVEELLGPDLSAQFGDYTKNLASTLTAQQFKDTMTGTDEEKAAKSQQLAQVMKEETAAVLSGANLPADYQVVPILNFGNIASEQEADQSLSLLDSIYQRVAARGSSFLSPDDLTKFQQFTTTAINNNRTALSMNRTLMAPISN
jgi:hypothetical protein